MSDLTFAERHQFEKLLGMNSGYVLDFTNRTFAEFILDSTGRDIDDHSYDNRSNSKAYRLRMFWQKEDNAVVGKLMSDMLNYLDEAGPRVEMCRLIVARLRGGRTELPRSASENGGSTVLRSQSLAHLKDELDCLAREPNRSKAGLGFEKLLNHLFDVFQLKPRQPFRVIGEQIDGSFEMDGQIYLLELKWENRRLPEEDLLVFRGKIEGESTFTRGVFIALNGITEQARDAITRGKAPSFFVMDGYDLMMILSDVVALPDFLRRRVRLLGEAGLVCVPFSEVA